MTDMEHSIKFSSLDRNFMASTPGGSIWEKIGSKLPGRLMRRKLAEMPFNEAFDRIRESARQLIETGRADEVTERIERFASLIERKGGLSGENNDLYAALMQTLTAVYVSIDKGEEALKSAARTLTLLAREAKRKDESFRILLALTLHDLALVHFERSEFRHAEREIEKAMKLFERLAASDEERYAQAHVTAQSALTAVLKSRTRQANMLKEHQEATEKYLQMMNDGVEGATCLLVDSLSEAGRTLLRMGKYREAVQFLSRALKYLMKIESETSLRQLQLSIDLGESLINVKQTRDKGIHLLNTMLYKASKLHAEEDHRRITEILTNSKTKQLDILGFWYKLFPKT